MRQNAFTILFTLRNKKCF